MQSYGDRRRDREDDRHHVIRSTHPYLFYKVDAPKMMIGLRSRSMDGFLHSYIQSSLDDGVALHGDIAPRRPLDKQRGLDAPHLGASHLDFRRVETLGEFITTQRVWDRLKEEGDTLSFSAPPILISYTTLI